MHLRHQCYVPAGVTASTHRSDFYFDGDEFDEFHEVIEQWTSMSVKCQVCGERIECADGSFYAEVHHIRPLGGNHGGHDIQENMLILCTTHHAMFDLRLPRFLSLNEVRINGVNHRVRSRRELDFHRSGV